MEELYSSNPSNNPIPGLDTQAAQQCMRLFQNIMVIHNREDVYRRMIQRLFESEFIVQDPSGTRQISSKLLMQAIWRIVNKMKPLDWTLNGVGIDNPERTKAGITNEDIESITRDGVSTVMDHGNYAQCLRDKNGAFFQMALWGDAFVHVGAGDGDYPIQFRVGSLSDVYIDQYCTDIRDPVGGLSANEVACIYRYSWDTFHILYPDEEDVGVGKIPRGLSMYKQGEKTWMQESTDKSREVEVCYYFNLGQKTFTVFAGAAMTIIEEKNGDDFPFIIDGKPYIPILHFKCFPSSEGFHNRGVGHLLFDIAVMAARYDNMAYKHMGRNIDPINIINTPKNEVSNFFQKVRMAQAQIASGGEGYVVNGYDASGNTPTTIANMQTPPLTQEWERAFTRLEQQIVRLGIKLDNIDYGNQKTLGQIQAEEENSDMLVTQIMDYNASEFKFAVELTINFIKRFIGKNNKKLVDSSTTVYKGDKEMSFSGFTLGDISEQLKQGDWFVQVNSRSGAIPSKTMERAGIMSTIASMIPGSPAYNRLAVKLARLNGQDIDMGSLQAPQQPMQQGQQQAPNEGEIANTSLPNQAVLAIA